MTMTLQEAYDWLVEVRKRNAINASLDNLDDHDAEAVIQALDAHLAAMGEPVRCVTISHFRGSPNMENHDFDYYGSLPDGTHTLFSAPPASGDWDKVREVIEDLRRCQSKEHALRIADRLAAALPESHQ